MKEGYGDGCKDTLFLMKEAMTDFTTPVRVLQSGRATIIFWKDDSKTVVKCQEGTEPDFHAAFCAAFVKHWFESSTRVNKVISEIPVTVLEPKKKKTTPEKKPESQTEVKTEPREAKEEAKTKQKEPKEEAKPKKPVTSSVTKKRNQIDHGKILALHNAGWDRKKIAEEMNCSDWTVWNVLKTEGGNKDDGGESAAAD